MSSYFLAQTFDLDSYRNYNTVMMKVRFEFQFHFKIFLISTCVFLKIDLATQDAIFSSASLVKLNIF